MYGLAEYLALSQTGARVLLTTTTKIGAAQCRGGKLLLGSPSADEIEAAFTDGGFPFVGGGLAQGKVTGVQPEYLDRLMDAEVADYVIVEADGAKHLPFKAYEANEPVIPISTSLQVVLLGAEILIAPSSAANTFRYPLFRERWGRGESSPLTCSRLAEILCSRDEYMKGAVAGSKKMLLINKCDLLQRDKACNMHRTAGELAGLLTCYDYLAFASLRDDRLYYFAALREGGLG